MLHANLITLCFIEPELLPVKVLHWGNRDFCLFAPVTLTFIYEPDSYSIVKALENFFWKKLFLESFGSYRLTDRHDQKYIPHHFAGGQ